MADQSEVDRVLGQYGQGYKAPQLNSGDGEIASTSDILAQYGANERMASGVPGFLRRIGAGLRSLAPSQVTTPVNTLTGREPNLQAREAHANPALLMAGEGADTMASWMDMHPGVDRGQSRPQDLLAPLGLSAMAPLTAVNNAAGIFGGRLARTADREALSRAEEMAGRGADRREIWDQTGWFQGRDGQWRFEIDDTGSQFRREPITPHERNVVGDIRFGDHFDHPELFAAYPGLERAPFSVEPHGGIGSYDPVTGTVAVGRHPPRDIQGGRRGAALHEGQHAVQAYENFARGAALEVYAPEARALQDQMRESQAVIRMRELVAAGTETPQSAAEWVGRGENIAPDRLMYLDREFPGSAMADRVQYSREQWQRANPLMKYLRTAGEVESRNVQERANLTGDERRARPPWETQDVPDADQILRQYSQGPQMSTKGPPMDEAARLARAREQGFDVDNPMYHGTKVPVEAFDLRRAGVSDPGLVGRAVYGTPEREQAGMFAMSPHYGRGDAPNVMPLYHGMRNPAIIQDGVLPDGRTLTEAHPRGITRESAAALNRELKAAGYDGAIFKLGDEVTQYAVFDPTRVRSTRAEFDPAQSRSPNLLASDPSTASLPGTILNQYGPRPPEEE